MLASSSQTILVAEDDPGVRELVRTRLDVAGYRVHTVKNGVDALRRVRELNPDALVLDINMPLLDGFGVLAQLKTLPKLKVRTLVLTARHASEDVRRALSMGARDYMAKPFDDAILLARVARLLRAPRPVDPSRVVRI